MTSAVVLKRVRAGYPGRTVLREIDFEVGEGEFVGILGPNGSGKTTLVRVISGRIVPEAGRVDWPGVSRSRSLPRHLAAVPQNPEVDPALDVRSLVMLGRLPWFGPLQWNPSPADRAAVADALDVTGTADLGDRRIGELSGGERQRALLAMGLAREPAILVLDEPSQNLDIKHRIELFRLLRRLRRVRGKTVIAVLHDLNLAALYCDRLLLLRAGVIMAQGSPAEVLREPILAELYGIEVTVAETERGPVVLPRDPGVDGFESAAVP
ncbi:MAG TPA: ABC transporter ATP-binding protein [bacterium]|nr:ABC transporter ATP-binding protein [bacterium]HPJ71403.1 ABC transporter ATP-binding protein [bacterium]HPQ66218.1 ABC transporter ATP-binding protein [bacterium]